MEHNRISSQGSQTPPATRNRHSADTAATTASPGDFFALLSAQGAVPPLAEPDTATLEGTDLDIDGVGAAGGLATMAVWSGLMAPATGGLAQATLPGTRVLADNGMGGAGPLVGGHGLPQGLVAETVLLDGAGDVKEAGLPGGVGGYGRMLSRMQGAFAPRAGGAGHGVLPDAATGRAGMGVASQHPAALQGLAQALQAGSASPAVGAGLPAVAQSERHGGSGSAALPSEALSSGAWGGISAPVSVRSDGAAGERRSGESAFGAGGWSGGDGGSVPTEASGLDGASMFADPAQAGAEDSVTDQVAYWVNQKTQNAEMTLDRDGQPVEVSVSLSGNEAHVTFRSDQSETRELLDRSMAQLSALLRSEGLVLSGMSVGTSARDGSGGGDAEPSRQRERNRQTAQVTASVPDGTPGASRPSGTSHRAVDIFV